MPAWERYVDELHQDEQWKELMAMRTGLKQQFYTLFPRIVESFKRHVRMLGNEGRILSPSDAKHYFCFFLDPGSTTFKRLLDELHKPIDTGKYKHEDYDPATGQRSYCGVPIPADAPPRPNGQAVWCEEKRKWIFWIILHHEVHRVFLIPLLRGARGVWITSTYAFFASLITHPLPPLKRGDKMKQQLWK